MGQFYFEFESIDWYQIEIDGSDLLDLEGKSNLTFTQKLQTSLIIGEEPKSINDTLFISELENIGFKKSIITNSKKVKAINKIFREKIPDIIIDTDCIVVYRNIFIFKEKNNIKGIAKICFGCSKHKIYGTKADTDYFGQSGDYEKLEALLKEKKL